MTLIKVSMKLIECNLAISKKKQLEGGRQVKVDDVDSCDTPLSSA